MKNAIIGRVCFRLMGTLVLILGIRMIGEGIYNYIDEHNQKNWVFTTAYVIDISSDYSGTGHNRRINYDIMYRYEVDGKEYSGELYNSLRAGKPTVLTVWMIARRLLSLQRWSKEIVS